MNIAHPDALPTKKYFSTVFLYYDHLWVKRKAFLFIYSSSSFYVRMCYTKRRYFYKVFASQSKLRCMALIWYGKDTINVSFKHTEKWLQVSMELTTWFLRKSSYQ